MFCPSCGTENKEGSKFCWKCGEHLAQNLQQEAAQSDRLLAPAKEAAPTPVVRQMPAVPPVRQSASPASPAYSNLPAPDNFLVQAILVTLCCCLPFGIASIVYASQVNSKVLAGDMAGAHESAGKARFWFWWALGVGLPVQILLVLVQIAAGFAD